jgi:hypothetical protein
LGPNTAFTEYTRNWIAFEVGLAAAHDSKNIWVFEPSNENVQFPIPYLHHYVLYDLDDNASRRYIESIVKEYEKRRRFRSFPQGEMDVKCPNDDCQAIFRLHTKVDEFNCPTCRSDIEFQQN